MKEGQRGKGHSWGQVSVLRDVDVNHERLQDKRRNRMMEVSLNSMDLGMVQTHGLFKTKKKSIKDKQIHSLAVSINVLSNLSCRIKAEEQDQIISKMNHLSTFVLYSCPSP